MLQDKSQYDEITDLKNRIITLEKEIDKLNQYKSKGYEKLDLLDSISSKVNSIAAFCTVVFWGIAITLVLKAFGFV